MDKKEYIVPQLEVLQTLPSEIIAFSGEQTGLPAYDPEDEVDASDALSKRGGNWEFEW